MTCVINWIDFYYSSARSLNPKFFAVLEYFFNTKRNRITGCLTDAFREFFHYLNVY